MSEICGHLPVSEQQALNLLLGSPNEMKSIFVSGRTGCGKSHFLRRYVAAALARDRGVETLWGEYESDYSDAAISVFIERTQRIAPFPKLVVVEELLDHYLYLAPNGAKRVFKSSEGILTRILDTPHDVAVSSQSDELPFLLRTRSRMGKRPASLWHVRIEARDYLQRGTVDLSWFR